MDRLKGKVALVTGATGGIGQIVSRMFAREGAALTLLGRREPEGEALAAEIRAAGGQAQFVATDVTEPDSVEAAVAATVRAYGKLDVLYNNAGGSSPRDGLVTEAPLDQFWKTIKLDLYGTYLACRFAIPEIVKAGGGSVVNTASIMGVMGIPKRDAYTAAKGGVIAMTRSMAVEYAPHKVRVNVIVPATVATERVADMIRKEPHLKGLIAGHILGLVEPEEIGWAAIYLASDESRATTGQILGVDSGATIS